MAVGRFPGVTRFRPLPGQFPGRSPGPLGINDAADPNVPARPADSPGPMGFHDRSEGLVHFGTIQALALLESPNALFPAASSSAPTDVSDACGTCDTELDNAVVADEQDEKPFQSSRVKKFGSTEQTAFKRKVYDLQLKRTLRESDATWKILISPTPLVGPDRLNKNDNHSNAGFAHEGDEIRAWLKEHVPDNFFVVCGDRHWQYHSVHPTAGTQEFSVGAASDSHAGGSPGENKDYHRFHRVKGGFLSVELKPMGGQSQIAFQLRDVGGTVVYEARFRRDVA